MSRTVPIFVNIFYCLWVEYSLNDSIPNYASTSDTDIQVDNPNHYGILIVTMHVRSSSNPWMVPNCFSVW